MVLVKTLYPACLPQRDAGMHLKGHEESEHLRFMEKVQIAIIWICLNSGIQI